MSDRLPQHWSPSVPQQVPPSAPSMDPALAAGAFEDEPTLSDLLVIMRRHWRLVTLVTLLVTGLTAWAVYTAVPRYRAQATLRLQDERRMLTGGLETGALEGVMGRQADPLLSEIQVLRSRAVMGEVVEREGLRLALGDGALPRDVLAGLTIAREEPDTLRIRYHADHYDVQSAAAQGTARYGDPVTVGGTTLTIARRPPDAEYATAFVVTHNEAVENLMARLNARQRDRTDVFDLEFISGDPLLAQRVVNSAADVFRARNVEAAQQQSRRRREFVEARLSETELMLTQAQQALSAFQTREQLFSSRERSAAQQVTLHNLEVRREELLSERRMFNELMASVSQRESPESGLRTVVSSPSIAQNPVISQLYTQLVRYEVVRDSMRASGSSTTNPDYVRVTQLIEGTERNLVSALESHITALDARISASDEMRRRQAAELAAMPQVQAEEAVLLLEVQTIQRMADLLREEAQRARIAEAVEAGKVDIVDLATRPTRPINDRKGLKLAIGMFIGLILGGGGALLRERMNTSIRTREEIERHLQLPPLAVVPQFANGHSTSRLSLARLRHIAPGRALTAPRSIANGRLVTIADPHSPGSEAYRKLRTSLIFSQISGQLRKVVVTSSAAAEGKSTTAANLAVCYAQQGMRVLLVDCDLRRPSLHMIFHVPKDPGLTELILERASLDDVTRPTEVAGLWVITSGVQPPNPAEMVAGPRMRAVIAELDAQYDMIVFDTPPVLAASEGPVLAVRTDGAIVVVRAGQTDRRSIQLAIHQLRTVGAHTIGVVLNDVDGKVPKYGYYDAYYYTYYGKDEIVPATRQT